MERSINGNRGWNIARENRETEGICCAREFEVKENQKGQEGRLVESLGTGELEEKVTGEPSVIIEGDLLD